MGVQTVSSRDQVKDQIKERADLASIVSKHTKLVKASRGYKACCPLPGHKEKTPSFNLNPTTNTYYCFGCNRGGDVFTFLEIMEGLSFKEALEELAAQYHIEIPKYNKGPIDVEAAKQAKSEKEMGFDILERATVFFHNVLMEKSTAGAVKAAEYLEKRGMTDAEIRELRLGFAPEAGSVLTKKITKKDEFEIAKKVGLIGYFEDGNRHYDFFRDRMMISIQDVRGRVVGFSGRVLDPLSKTNKYVNSRESEWFKKKAIVYGLHRAVPLIRNQDFLCIVEGYFDQWALHRLDIPAVAVMGTALTEEHLQLIARYTKRIILVLDADAPGIAATKKSLPLVMKDNWDVKVFSGFEGKDPDEWLQKNALSPEQLKQKILASSDGLEWLAKNVVKEASALKVGRMQLFERLKDIWVYATSEARKNILADELAPLLGLDRKMIRDSLDDLVNNAGASGGVGFQSVNSWQADPRSSDQPLTRGLRTRSTAQKASGDVITRMTEELFVWWIRHFEELTPKSSVEWEVFSEVFDNTDVYEFMCELRTQIEVSKTLPKLANLPDFLGQLQEFESMERVRAWILKGLVEPESTSDATEKNAKISFSELASQLQREKVKNEINRLQNELRDTRSDPAATAQILQKVQGLRIRLEKSK